MKRGIGLIEVVIYIAVLTIITIVVINTMLAMSESFAQIRQARRVNASAALALDRMTHEVRQAAEINLAESVFGSNPGQLQVDSSKFFLQGGQLMLQEGLSAAQPLTSNKVKVTSLVFWNLSTTTSQATKVKLEIDGRNFYSTAVLRESY